MCFSSEKTYKKIEAHARSMFLLLTRCVLKFYSTTIAKNLPTPLCPLNIRLLLQRVQAIFNGGGQVI